MWVHVSIMHCSFELFVTLPLPVLLLAPVAASGPAPQETAKRRRERRARREGGGEEGEEEREEQDGRRNPREGNGGRKEVGTGRIGGRREGERASERHIHCPPPTKPSFFAEVARSRWTGRSSGSDGNRRSPTIFCIRGAADSTAAAAAAAMATAAGATVHRCQ